MVNRIEELGDIQIQHPVPLPASLATLRHRIQRRPLRPIPVRIIMENRFHTRQQLQRKHRLSDSVGHSRNPEDPGAPTVRLWYLHGPHRGWKVGPRGHPVPDPVKIVLQICFECLDGLPIHPSGTLICLDALVRLPHQPLRDLKRLVLRFRLAHSSPPRTTPGCSRKTNHRCAGPFAPLPLQKFQRYYEPVRQRVRIGTQRLTVSAARRTPSRHPPPFRAADRRIGTRLPTFRVAAADQTRATFTPDTAWPVSGSPARLIPKLYTYPGFDAISCFSMLQQWFAHARLSDPCLTTLTPPFPQSLTTTVFSQCSTRRLDVSLRRATPKGHKTFIYYTALLHKGRPTLQPPCRIRGTRA